MERKGRRRTPLDGPKERRGVVDEERRGVSGHDGEDTGTPLDFGTGRESRMGRSYGGPVSGNVVGLLTRRPETERSERRSVVLRESVPVSRPLVVLTSRGFSVNTSRSDVKN